VPPPRFFLVCKAVPIEFYHGSGYTHLLAQWRRYACTTRTGNNSDFFKIDVIPYFYQRSPCFRTGYNTTGYRPELDRQGREVIAQRNAYDRGGIILLISAVAMIAWLGWFRPRHRFGAGAPAKILRFVEKAPDSGKKKPERSRRIPEVPPVDSGPVE
jgi:hypothetical protein